MKRGLRTTLALLATACVDSASSEGPSESRPNSEDASLGASSHSDAQVGETSERSGAGESRSVPASDASLRDESSEHVSASTSGSGAAGTPGEMNSGETNAGELTSVSSASDASPVVHPCGAPAGAAWRRCDGNPLWQAGFEHVGVGLELSVGDPDVMFDAEAGLYKAWWSVGIAPGYVDADVTMGIKYAESADGVNWVVQEELALTGSRDPSDWDYSKLETPSIVKVPEFPPERRYVLFYAGGNDLEIPAPEYTWYQIGVAFSADGKHFERLPSSESPYASKSTPFDNVEGLIIYGTDAFPPTLAGLADGLVADPEVIYEDGVLHLFFSSMGVDADRNPLAYGVSHATSMDAVHWTFASENPVSNLGGAGPSVVKSEHGYELWFYADSDADKAEIPSTFNPMYGVFRSSSTNLNEWAPANEHRDLTWDGSVAAERYGMIATGDMLFHDGEYRYYYPAFGDFDVPDDFVVPTHDDYVPAVIMLNLAYRR